MRSKNLLYGLLLSVVLLFGCGAKKESSGSAAIEKSNDMATVEQKVDYLVGQAKAFYKSDEYKEAIKLSQHVLSKLDGDSKAAQALLEKSKKELGSMAENLKSKMGM